MLDNKKILVGVGVAATAVVAIRCNNKVTLNRELLNERVSNCIRKDKDGQFTCSIRKIQNAIDFLQVWEIKKVWEEIIELECSIDKYYAA